MVEKIVLAVAVVSTLSEFGSDSQKSTWLDRNDTNQNPKVARIFQDRIENATSESDIWYNKSYRIGTGFSIAMLILCVITFVGLTVNCVVKHRRRQQQGGSQQNGRRQHSMIHANWSHSGSRTPRRYNRTGRTRATSNSEWHHSGPHVINDPLDMLIGGSTPSIRTDEPSDIATPDALTDRPPAVGPTSRQRPPNYEEIDMFARTNTQDVHNDELSTPERELPPPYDLVAEQLNSIENLICTDNPPPPYSEASENR